ncbi:MAG: YHS domain-containing (seleno)protein [Paraglaciecola sp.]|uniref:YHS domain-containing (seleno)protein n=1 Tax=Paraglaciecola sp. TaxID=1920173 RepID=UPI0032665BC1
MNKFLKTISILVFALFALPALSADSAVKTGIFNNTAIEGYDTVAYFTHSKPVKGSDRFTFIWRDAEWRFSNEKNLEMFKQSPEKYAAQYGGYCAWAMASGKTASIDPKIWFIENGKLYLNYNKKVQEDWFSDLEADILAADQKYPEVTDVRKYQ